MLCFGWHKQGRADRQRQRRVGRGVKVAIWQYQQSSEVQSEVLSSLQHVCVWWHLERDSISEYHCQVTKQGVSQHEKGRGDGREKTTTVKQEKMIIKKENQNKYKNDMGIFKKKWKERNLLEMRFPLVFFQNCWSMHIWNSLHRHSLCRLSGRPCLLLTRADRGYHRGASASYGRCKNVCQAPFALNTT